MTTDFGKVAVVMGGNSSEREVSLNSGEAVLQSLLNNQINAVGVDAKDDVYQLLRDEKVDRVFNVLHGRGGEDGQLQALLNFMQIPYTGSGVAASAIAMDKLKTKKIWLSEGLPTPKFFVLSSQDDFHMAVKELGLPLFVKPVAEGSSVGITKVKSAEDIEAAWLKAKQYGEVIAEQFVAGGEYTTAIVADEALPIIHMQASNEFYDYSAKYLQDDTQYFCPSGLESSLEEKFKKLSLSAAQAIGLQGWGRIDFMLDANDNMQLIELNTVPGMTNHSLVPMAAKQVGLNFDALVLKILEVSIGVKHE